eukprot:474898_1
MSLILQRIIARHSIRLMHQHRMRHMDIFSITIANYASLERISKHHKTVIDKINKLHSTKTIFSMFAPKDIKKNEYDENVFLCAINRCNQLKSAKSCKKIMDLCIKHEVDSIHCYNAMLQAFCDQNERTQQSFDLLTIMVENMVFPNIMSFHILLQQCINLIDVKSAEKVWAKMDEFCVKYDRKSYLLMIIVYQKGGDLESIDKKIQQITDSKIILESKYQKLLKDYNQQTDKNEKIKLLIQLEQIMKS